MSHFTLRKAYMVWLYIEGVNYWSLTTLSNAFKISAVQWTIKRSLILTSFSAILFSSSGNDNTIHIIYRLYPFWIVISPSSSLVAGAQLAVYYCYYYYPFNVYTHYTLSATPYPTKAKGNFHTSVLMTIYIIGNTFTHPDTHMWI